MEENMQNEQMPEQPKKVQHTSGPAIAIVIVVAILAIGGVYYWTNLVEDLPPETPVNIDRSTDPETDELSNVSSSDELGDIEGDLEKDFDDLDSDFSDIDKALAE